MCAERNAARISEAQHHYRLKIYVRERFIFWLDIPRFPVNVLIFASHLPRHVLWNILRRRRDEAFAFFAVNHFAER